jgi:hypothetical protein
MSNFIAIEPKKLVKIATSICIDNTVIRFGENDNYAFASVTYYNDLNESIKSETVKFTAEELSTWADDDAIFIDLVKTKLNLS